MLEQQREVLQLAAEELKLKHERSARHKAIDIANAMMLGGGSSATSKVPLQHAYQSTAQQPSTKTSATITVVTTTSTSQKSLKWCIEAAEQFNITEPVGPSQGNSAWGSMKRIEYRTAWTAHSCDALAFINHTTKRPSTMPSSVRPHSMPMTSEAVATVPSVGSISDPGGGTFTYLRKDRTSPRQKITVSRENSWQSISLSQDFPSLKHATTLRPRFGWLCAKGACVEQNRWLS